MLLSSVKAQPILLVNLAYLRLSQAVNSTKIG